MRRRVGPIVIGLVALLAAGCNPSGIHIGASPATGSAGSAWASSSTVQASATVSPHGFVFWGWGTSLAWWAEQMPGFMNQQQIMDDLFTEPGANAPAGTPGLGLNVLRYNLGASLSSSQESPSCKNTMPPGRTVPSLEPRPGKVNAGNDPNQEQVLKEAVTLINGTGASPVTEAFANSPPWWLLNSPGQCTSGGSGGAPDLPAANDTAYARYLYQVVTALEKKTGVYMNTVEPFNEPDSNWWKLGNTQEGSAVPAAQQAGIIQDLTQQPLQPTSIAAPDTNTPGQAAQEFASGPMAGVRSDLSQVNTHGYDNGTAMMDPNSVQWAQLRQAVGTGTVNATSLSMSETGIGKTSFTTARELSQEVAGSLNNLWPQTWVYWQAVDAQPNQPGGWGLVSPTAPGPSAPASSQEPPPSLGLRYWIMDQYSRFIRPGATVFPTTGNEDTLVALNGHGPYKGQYVVVLTNPNSGNETFSVNLAGAGLSAATATGYQTTATSGGMKAAANPATVSGGTLTATTPGSSVTTYVLTPSAASRSMINCQNTAQVEPSQFILTCADAGERLTGMTWSSWGTTATGSGTEQVNDCTPDCADGTFHSYPVNVTLSGGAPMPPDSNVTAGDYYTTMTISYPGSRPAVGSPGGSPAQGPSTQVIQLWSRQAV
jgi:O-Glycosyl hydrolase family 30